MGQLLVREDLDRPDMILLADSRDHQCRTMAGIMQKPLPDRWTAIAEPRQSAIQYCQQVAPREQPFLRVRNMMEHCRRRNIATGSSDTDTNILQTRGIPQGIALLILLDLALLQTFST